MHNVMLIKGEEASADSPFKLKKFVQETCPSIEVYRQVVCLYSKAMLSLCQEMDGVAKETKATVNPVL